MKRPVLHDQRFAMSDELRAHIKALEEYASYLEGGIEMAKGVIADKQKVIESLSQTPTVKPNDSFGSLLDGFFGTPKGKS